MIAANMAQVIWFGTEIGSHVAQFYINRVNRVHSYNGCAIFMIMISTKWTDWMAEILFSFDVSLHVCFCVCLCAVDRSIRPV